MKATAADAGFPGDYESARTAFRATCAAAGGRLEVHENPVRSPLSTALTTDSAWFGPEQAEHVLVITSGVHGTELLCGSGCQTRLVTQGLMASLPRDVGVLLVHAINPWGAVHWRRNTEDNVDLCRNFIDFGNPSPANPAYARVRSALRPPPLSEIDERQAQRVIRELQQTLGPRDFMNGLMAGQYDDPLGFSFGGHRESWSRKVLVDLITRHAADARQIGIVDLHTGLGPYAYGMAVCLHRGMALARARRWFGHWVFAPRELPADSPEGLFDVTGHCSDGYEAAFGAARVTAVVLEFGTYPPDRVFPTLIQDHWLNALGQPAGPTLERIRAEMREIHYPNDGEWRESAWERTRQVTRQALAGLTDRTAGDSE